MQLLTNNKDCDLFIKKELKEADIDIVKGDYIPLYSEVPYRLYGKLEHLVFKRYWRYWVVNGDIPLDLALEIYKSDFTNDISLNGCEKDPSDSFEERYLKERYLEGTSFKIVTGYHIFSQEALNYFVKLLKTNNFVSTLSYLASSKNTLAYYVEVTTIPGNPIYKVIEPELESRFLQNTLDYARKLVKTLHGVQKDGTPHLYSIFNDYEQYNN